MGAEVRRRVVRRRGIVVLLWYGHLDVLLVAGFRATWTTLIGVAAAAVGIRVCRGWIDG